MVTGLLKERVCVSCVHSGEPVTLDARAKNSITMALEPIYRRGVRVYRLVILGEGSVGKSGKLHSTRTLSICSHTARTRVLESKLYAFLFCWFVCSADDTVRDEELCPVLRPDYR